MNGCRAVVMWVPGGTADDMRFWAMRGFPCKRAADGRIELTIERDCDALGSDGRCTMSKDRPRLCREIGCGEPES